MSTTNSITRLNGGGPGKNSPKHDDEKRIVFEKKAGVETECKEAARSVKVVARNNQKETGAANNERQKKNRAAKKAHKDKERSKKVPNPGGEEKEIAAADAAQDAEDEKETVVHPWHLNFVKHTWVDNHHVSLDDKSVGHGVYRVASHADNMVGTGLFRKIVGQGLVALPRVWGNLRYIEAACEPLAGEALGKLDFDLKYLVPRALVNLSKWCTAWPGVETEIIEYLTSAPFSSKVVTHYSRKLNRVNDVLTAKCLRYAAKISASHMDVTRAMQLYTKSSRYFVIIILWWLMAFMAIFALSVYVPKFKMQEIGAAISVLLTCWATRSWININDKTRRILLELYSEKFAVSYGSLIEVASSCSNGIELPALLSCWKFKLSAGLQTLACIVKKPYQSFGTWIAGVNMAIPNGCHHDQYNGLVIRFFFDRTIDKIAIAALMESSKQYFRDLVPVAAWKEYSYDEWVTHLTGRRGRMLLEEPEAVSVSKYIPVNIFVKLEAYLGKNFTSFKPRIIQGRELAYQNIVGPHFYSVSKWMGVLFHSGCNLIYDSGLDALELGRIAMNMFATKRRVFEIDVSNWDGSLVPEWAAFEIWFIENVIPHLPPRWVELRKHWNDVEGNGKKGVSYKTKHGRRSGDMWTSCFNSLINLMILHFIFGVDVLAVAKGDDNFFGTNSSLTVEEIVAIYARFGMKAKVKEVFHISRLGYCSGTFYPVQGGWKWGLKPFRIISKFGLNLNRHPPKLHARLLYGTAISMLPIGGHVPVLGTLLRRIVASGKAQRLDAIVVDEPWKNTSDTVDEVHPSAYGFFCDLYGFDIDDVDDLEFQCGYNVYLRRPLLLEDFPIIFDDPRFLRGFQVDADVDVVPETSNVTLSRRSNKVNYRWDVMFNVLLLSPLLEEGLRHVHNEAFSVLLAFAEFLLSGQYFKLLFHSMMCAFHRVFGFWPSVFVHFAWNLTILLSKQEHLKFDRLEVGYGSLGHLLQMTRETLSRRRAGVFTPMSNCVALTKHRLMDNAAMCYSIWCSKSNTDIKNDTPKQSKQGKKTSKGGKQKNSQKKKGSLGRSLLTSGLGSLGSVFGPMGAGVGSSLGGWASDLLGMGDYKVNHNSLEDMQGVPNMHRGQHSIRVKHKEALGDITGSTGFSLKKFVIQPGATITFPWLSNIAGMFQSYKIHGLAFEFVSTSADALNSVNTALGSVIMATNYNVSLPDFLSKVEMECTEFSCITRPSRNLLHLVECDPRLQVSDHLYLRSGELPAGQDLQFYDWGNFYLATVGMQAAATIGELWVTYDIEFFKPRIISGGQWPGEYSRIVNGPYTAATNVLGDVQITPKGSLGVSVSSGAAGFQRILFPSSITSGKFFIMVEWDGTTTAAIAIPAITLSNLTGGINQWNLNSNSELFVPAAGNVARKACYITQVTVNGYSALGSYLEFGTAGILPGTPTYVNIFVVSIPASDSVF